MFVLLGQDYGESVAAAVSNCALVEAGGCFVFTSSGGVYSENSGGMVDEESEVASQDNLGSEAKKSASPRTMGILRAEKAVLQHPGGIVLRLGGLYTL